MKSTLLPCVLVFATAGCSGGEPAPTLPETDGPPDWIVEVVRAPEAFTELLERSGREGWIAFHGNDLREADDAYTGDGDAVALARSRARWHLGLFYEDLARASDHAHMTFLSSWQARELDRTPGLDTVSAQWRACGGLDALGVDDPEKLPPIFRTEAGRPEVLTARQAVHDKASAGDLEALYAVADEPLVVEQEEDFERRFFDACVYHTLHDAWDTRARETVGADDWRGVARSWTGEAPLEGRIFAPWLTRADLEAEIAHHAHPGLLGATQPSLADFAVPTETSVQDDVEVAREDVRALDAALDTRTKALLAEAGDDGDALLTDLGLHHRFRQEWIVTRARKALLENRPHQAMAYLELARDVSERQVGPANTPSVLALYAESQIRLGRTREALDVLSLLEEAHPEVAVLKELASDLAVLQGLDRQGDSKEN